jgi:hypothetical protein
MSSNAPFRSGPTAITTSIANMLNPPTLTGGVNASPPTNTFIRLTHIRVTNKTAASVAVSAWIGATGVGAAGTEFAWQSTPVGANSYLDWNGSLVLNVADFLTMSAGSNSALTVDFEGEIGCVA